jgi:Fe-S-cluster containining protein
MRTLLPLKLNLVNQPVNKPNCFEVDDFTVVFNGDCEACRPYCGSLCCTMFKYVALSEEEALSGRYRYKAVTPDCECEECQEMRAAGVEYSLLKKKPQGSCIYLDVDKKCTIYEYRPQTCRQFDCKGMVLPFQNEL